MSAYSLKPKDTVYVRTPLGPNQTKFAEAIVISVERAAASVRMKDTNKELKLRFTLLRFAPNDDAKLEALNHTPEPQRVRVAALEEVVTEPAVNTDAPLPEQDATAEEPRELAASLDGFDTWLQMGVEFDATITAELSFHQESIDAMRSEIELLNASIAESEAKISKLQTKRHTLAQIRRLADGLTEKAR